MARFTKLLMIGTLALAAMAPIASAHVFVRGYWGGGWGGGYWGPAYYGPAWYGSYGPGWGPYGYGYVSGPPAGSIKFDTKMKEAAVYVDGGYAGTVEQLKTFKLHPGAHNIELRSPDGHTFYQERVDIIAGKTLKITP